MALTLVNRSRTARTFNLTLGIAPIRRLHARAQRGPDGVTRATDRRLVYPDSITLLAGERRSGLPDQIIAAPEIASAIAKRTLSWSPDPVEDASTPEAPAEEVPAEEASLDNIDSDDSDDSPR